MDIMFLNFVMILIVFTMSSSSGEDCTRYFTQRDVSIKRNGDSKEMKLEKEIHGVQCTEYCEKDQKCMAIVAENSYKTKTCCLLYNSPVVTATGTGTGNQALYYKPGTKLIQVEPNIGSSTTTTQLPWQHVTGYYGHVGITCNVTPIQTIPNNDDAENCAEICNHELDGCIGFTYVNNGECLFWDGACQVRDQVRRNDVITYVKN